MPDASAGTVVNRGPWSGDLVFTHLFSQFKVTEPWNRVKLNWGGPPLQFPFVMLLFLPQDLLGHLLNKPGNRLAVYRGKKMADMICRLFMGELAWEGTTVRCDMAGCFFFWTHNPTSPATVTYCYCSRSLFIYLLIPKMSRTRYTGLAKAPQYNVIRFSYITQFMKLCYDSFLQLK